MEPIWDRRKVILETPGLVDDIIQKGTKEAKKVASKTMSAVREVIGI